MIIYRPIYSWRCSQRFAENLACCLTDQRGNPIWPYIVRRVRNDKCSYGFVKWYPILGLKGHNGEDWPIWNGEPLYFSVQAETEWYAKNYKDADGGLGIDVYSKSPIDNGQYVKFRFHHIGQSLVKDYEPVFIGQMIARCDNTGASSGRHVHWAKKFCDANGQTIGRDNGYRGAVDFRVDFINEFVLNAIGQSYPLFCLLRSLLFNLTWGII